MNLEILKLNEQHLREWYEYISTLDVSYDEEPEGMITSEDLEYGNFNLFDNLYEQDTWLYDNGYTSVDDFLVQREELRQDIIRLDNDRE